MCQLIRRRYYCDHSSGESFWNPADVNDCEYARGLGVYDMNGRLLGDSCDFAGIFVGIDVGFATSV
jgi:hypothetical protein